MAILDWLTWDNTKALLNSEFTSAALGALAGAGFGAWAAQKIAERSKVREQLLQEVHDTNAAIDLAHSVCSTYLNLKDQHIRALRQRYDAQRAFVLDHRTGELDLGALDLRTLTNPPVRIERLDQVVLEKLSVSGRPRHAVGALALSIAQLSEVIAGWNERVAEYKSRPPGVDRARIAYLFGLPHGNVIDTSFFDCVRALYALTDDCIFFSKLLTSDLRRHGERTRRDFMQRGLRGPVPRVARLGWGDVEKKGLLPSDEQYVTWLTGFVRRPPHTYGRRMEKLVYGMRRTLRRSTFKKWLYWLSYMPRRANAD